jgi:tetratricopeptide (TPR) repeat protein
MHTQQAGYNEAVWRAFEAVYAQSSQRLSDQEISATCQRLLTVDPLQRALFLRNSGRARRLEVAQRLAQEAFAQRHDNLDVMLKLAELAVEVAEATEDCPQGRGLLLDTRAQAWGYLANAYRIKNKYTRAAICWDNAQQALRSGSGDPLLEAELLVLQADLHFDLAEFDCAHGLLQVAISLYEQIGDPHLVGRTLLQVGRLHDEADNLPQAIHTFREALRKIEPGRESQLTLIALLNLARCLARAGEHTTALAVLQSSAPIAELEPSSLLASRCRWLEAELLEQAGRLEESLRLHRAVRTAFCVRGQDLYAATAALGEAVVLAQLGRWAEVQELAHEMYPVFLSRSIGRDSAAALLLFTEAVEHQTATVALLREIRERVQAQG